MKTLVFLQYVVILALILEAADPGILIGRSSAASSMHFKASANGRPSSSRVLMKNFKPDKIINQIGNIGIQVVVILEYCLACFNSSSVCAVELTDDVSRKGQEYVLVTDYFQPSAPTSSALLWRQGDLTTFRGSGVLKDLDTSGAFSEFFSFRYQQVHQLWYNTNEQSLLSDSVHGQCK